MGAPLTSLMFSAVRVPPQDLHFIRFDLGVAGQVHLEGDVLAVSDWSCGRR